MKVILIMFINLLFLLVTDKKDELSIAGNYVLGTQQFEFVSVHGTPVNVMF